MKEFKEYLEKRIVKRKNPDLSRARDLIEESQRKYDALIETIEKIGIKDENANDIIESCYNILIFLIRAKLHQEGYKAEGFSAHEAEVSYLKNLNFSDTDIDFIDNLRSHRNNILYYGKRFQKENADKILEFLKNTEPKLKEILQKKS